MGAGLLLLVGRPSCCRLSRVRVHAATHLPVPPSRSRCSRDRRGRGPAIPGRPGTWSGGWYSLPEPRATRRCGRHGRPGRVLENFKERGGVGEGWVCTGGGGNGLDSAPFSSIPQLTGPLQQDRAGQGEGATRRRSRDLDRIQMPCSTAFRTAQRSLLENRWRGSQFLPSASPVQLIT
ncbi:hypothetical protein D623_10029343 [Myotis brandtii]|uniref:Uncharacterized protein n=1 Tax=Myotis brandtii TaxID=109478 RepID=S7N6J2_MYOBR|nr:hypothetical protein D623_10029343 [Myotis brandtii]